MIQARLPRLTPCAGTNDSSLFSAHAQRQVVVSPTPIVDGSMTQDVKPVATVDPDISISEKIPDFSFNFGGPCE